MDDFKERLTERLTAGFPGCELELEDGYGEGRWGGLLVWEGFAGKSAYERQTELWNFLKETFSQEERRRIAPFITMTPEGMAALRELD